MMNYLKVELKRWDLKRQITNGILFVEDQTSSDETPAEDEKEDFLGLGGGASKLIDRLFRFKSQQNYFFVHS